MSVITKCWSVDGEIYYNDLSHFAEEAKDLELTVIHEGESVQKEASKYLPDIELILDAMRESAWEDCGESSEDFCDSVSTEAKDELEALLIAWADKHIEVNFYAVRNSREVGIDADGEIFELYKKEPTQ